ncbi:ATP-dependent DNA helicase [Nocardioides limicola]|uniref:ATP-dependent DNA helicase n=1 Tax=Nocardioides limicola TaxID=2803368 RepID=UPI00193B9889|nr:ATP-dependent DNA helicase [Nocardioides sp. DJM-14]
MIAVRTPADLQRVMGTPFAPSAQQWTAISAPLEPGVVIAGAGSGKTTLMAARVVYLVVTGQVRPDQVLGLTFTTKAAAELRTRILDALTAAGVLATPDPTAPPAGEEADILEPTVATYNAYAAALLTDHGLRIGHEPDTRVITDAARYQLGARVVQRHTGEIAALSDHPPTVIQWLLQLDAAMSEHLVTPAQVLAEDATWRRGFSAAIAEERAGKARKSYIDGADTPGKAITAGERRQELLGLVGEYRHLKQTLGLMDFSDQIALGARLADEQPAVGAAERDRFRVVLLDEYQDTSVAQALMLARLFGGGHPVTAVGDPNQAIYGWRGASVSNIVHFPEVFRRADGSPATIHHLTVNRRSRTRILDVANHLAGPLLEKYPVAPLEAAPDAAPGEVEVRVFESSEEELAWLVEAVRDAHDGRGADWSQIGVLTRDNKRAEAVYDVLTGAGVPVEIVGLAGLLRLPEVAHVVSVLHLMQDVTANAALLTLLTGPRWAIGPRDLRLLAQRAKRLAGGDGPDADTLTDQLEQIADGVDAVEVPALLDALEDPGAEASYSPVARERFALLADELRMLRRHVGEPLLDLVRRIVDVTGVDVELASAVGPAAASRRDNLDLFVKAVADFQAIDGDVSLAALLAYLTAEDDFAGGLDLATPSQADSVKLLTVHRSKGLEWAHVFCVGVCETKFPSTRGRANWTSTAPPLPSALRGDAGDQPQLDGCDKPALVAYRDRVRAHDREEELRLAYVAFTRAAERLAVTSYLWGEGSRPLGPSVFQKQVAEAMAQWKQPPQQWLDQPPKGATNPFRNAGAPALWPRSGVGREAELRRRAAALVAQVQAGEDTGLDMLEAAQVADWDTDLERLLGEARRSRPDVVEVPLPPSLSATALARLQDDPDGFAADLARPMPRPPSPAARSGSRFHAWVEGRVGQQSLIDADELWGRGDADVDDSELAELAASFERSEFADRVPHAVEAPFALVLGPQVVRGRIDAVYADGDGWLLVDWKTGRGEQADPLQLAVYRVAWAELTGVPVERVRAAFFHVRSGRFEEPVGLPVREDLEALLP